MNAPFIDTTNPAPLLNLRETAEIAGFSAASIHRLIAAGQFPKPMPIDKKRVGWRRCDLDEWQRLRAEGLIRYPIAVKHSGVRIPDTKRHPIVLPKRVHDHLQAVAEERRVSLQALLAMLLTTIADDDLVDAVLDDGVSR